MTVVLDYLTGRVIWMGPGRKKETLDAFFAGMTQPQKDAIEAVAMDMWDPYINRVQFHTPQAHIVFDHFHIVQSFGKVIDKVRRSEYLKADEEGRAVLKDSRYLLLKNEENLTEKQRPRLDELLALNETLNKVYLLKDQLKLVFYYSDRDIVKTHLDDWCDMASTITHSAIKAFVKQLRRHEYGILNHADYPIGTSELEGTNNTYGFTCQLLRGFYPGIFAGYQYSAIGSANLGGDQWSLFLLERSGPQVNRHEN